MIFTDSAPLQITDPHEQRADEGAETHPGSSPDVLQPRFASREAPGRAKVVKSEFASF